MSVLLLFIWFTLSENVACSVLVPTGPVGGDGPSVGEMVRPVRVRRRHAEDGGSLREPEELGTFMHFLFYG